MVASYKDQVSLLIIFLQLDEGTVACKSFNAFWGDLGEHIKFFL